MHQTPLPRQPKGESMSLDLGLASAGCQLWQKLCGHPRPSGGGKQDRTGEECQDPLTTASWLPQPRATPSTESRAAGCGGSGRSCGRGEHPAW